MSKKQTGIPIFDNIQFKEPTIGAYDAVNKELSWAVNNPLLASEANVVSEGFYNILALDVATHCGWCTKDAFGVWDLTNKRDESGGMKLIRFKAKLREMVSLARINLVAFERTSGMHKSSIISQSELHGVLKLFCEENSIEYRAYSAPEIKKFATGKGNSGKPLMIAAAASKYGYRGKDDNEADAIHIYNLIKTDLGL